MKGIREPLEYQSRRQNTSSDPELLKWGYPSPVNRLPSWNSNLYTTWVR